MPAQLFTVPLLLFFVFRRRCVHQDEQNNRREEELCALHQEVCAVSYSVTRDDKPC